MLLCVIFDTYSKCKVSDYFLCPTKESAKQSFLTWFVKGDHIFKDTCELQYLVLDLAQEDDYSTLNSSGDFSTLIVGKDAIKILNDYKEVNK